MFIRINPQGVNKPSRHERMALEQVISGDAWVIKTRVKLPWNKQWATPDNCFMEFALAQDRFSKEPLYEAMWDSGIESIDEVNLPGLIKIEIPEHITHTLRRGQYTFSLAISDMDESKRATIMTGDLLVEYEPTSPVHDIPYRK